MTSIGPISSQVMDFSKKKVAKLWAAKVNQIGLIILGPQEFKKKSLIIIHRPNLAYSTECRSAWTVYSNILFIIIYLMDESGARAKAAPFFFLFFFFWEESRLPELAKSATQYTPSWLPTIHLGVQIMYWAFLSNMGHIIQSPLN